jgi:ABC-type spermidine/putrescine transport system permease subunit II
VAGFLLSFTFSFDDYVITSFVSGPGSDTLPLFVFSQTRLGITPLTNAIAAMMLLVTLATLLVGQWVIARQARRTGDRSGTPLGLLET